MTKEEVMEIRERAIKFFDKVGIPLSKEEKTTIEVADFGLGKIKTVGLQLVTYVNTDRYCAKEMFVFPWTNYSRA